MRVGLIYNLKPPSAQEDPKGPADRYAEWDHGGTINAIRSALGRQHEVLLLDAEGQTRQQLRKSRPDFVFNIAEGTSGVSREAEIPMLLESLGIPYTGSAPAALSLCLDKARTKRLLQAQGILTPTFVLCEPQSPLPPCDFFPAIVKPNWEGSSKGILDSSVVLDEPALRCEVSRICQNYNQPALVEEFLNGREFTAAVMGNDMELVVLPIVEIALDCLPQTAQRIYSYEAKWLWDKPDKPLPILRCPAQIPEAWEREIRDTAIRTFKALGCRDWCRIDFRADAQGRIHVLEVNPLPGILSDPQENSCFPLAARTAGISYEDLILKILDIACRRAESANLVGQHASRSRARVLGTATVAGLTIAAYLLS